MSEDITISPFYYSAVNEITKPNSLVFTSHYFVDRWMRDLNPVGSAIVAVLRSHCYHNRTNGELRNKVQLKVSLIAAEVGVSAKTIRREMASNKVLQKFIQRQEEFTPGPTPMSLRTDAYTYIVAMDDPVHPFDEDALQAAIREKARLREKGNDEEDAKTRARRKQGDADPQKPPRQNDQAAMGTPAKLSSPPGQNVLPPAKLSSPPGQNDQTLKESLESSEFNKNPSSDFSLSLFPEQETPNPSPGEPLSLLAQAKLADTAWAELSEDARPPWLEQAERELVALHAGTGITPKAHLIVARAKNLYEMSRRGKN